MPPSLRARATVTDDQRRDILQQCRGRKLVGGRHYKVVMTFYGRWLTQDGLPRRRDVHNLPSKLIDVLAACLGVDDGVFARWEFEPVHTERSEYVTVEITDFRLRRA